MTGQDAPAFRRQLGLLDLTLIGVGGTIGVGIFVLTGTAAAQSAGPGVILSFLLAASACACAALCYAELASVYVHAGSAYVYARATLGTFVGWIVGWNLVLEYLFSCATVAVGWSSYFQSLIGLAGWQVPALLGGPPLVCPGACRPSGALFNLPGALVVIACGVVLLRGITTSAHANRFFTAVKLTVIALVIGLGAAHIDPANLAPLIPPNTGTYGEFGWSGVVRAAGLVFFAYVGFDQVSTCAQEARQPQRDVPLAILFALGICTLLYVAMATVMVGLAPYRLLDVANPVYVALEAGGPALAWLRLPVAAGATIGLISAVLVSLYGQTRIGYAMARDGMVPRRFAGLSERGVPVFGTLVFTAIAAIVAGLLPIDLLGELVSIGTLLVFVLICVGTMALRLRQPELPRGFRVPALWIVAPLAIAIALYMMFSLPAGTWWRLVIWLALGLGIYALRRPWVREPVA